MTSTAMSLSEVLREAEILLGSRGVTIMPRYWEVVQFEVMNGVVGNNKRDVATRYLTYLRDSLNQSRLDT